MAKKMQLTMFNVTIFDISFPFLLLLLEVIGEPGHGNYGVSNANGFGQVTHGRRGSREERAEADVPDNEGNRGFSSGCPDGFRSSASSCGVTGYKKD
jgi:hypothetical protein